MFALIAHAHLMTLICALVNVTRPYVVLPCIVMVFAMFLSVTSPNLSLISLSYVTLCMVHALDQVVILWSIDMNYTPLPMLNPCSVSEVEF